MDHQLGRQYGAHYRSGKLANEDESTDSRELFAQRLAPEKSKAWLDWLQTWVVTSCLEDQCSGCFDTGRPFSRPRLKPSWQNENKQGHETWLFDNWKNRSGYLAGWKSKSAHPVIRVAAFNQRMRPEITVASNIRSQNQTRSSSCPQTDLAPKHTLPCLTWLRSKQIES